MTSPPHLSTGAGGNNQITGLVIEVSQAVHHTGQINQAIARIAAEVADLMSQVDALAAQVHARVDAHDAACAPYRLSVPESVADDESSH